MFTSINANPDSLTWQQHFEQEFQRVKDWNERAIAEGRLEDTRYFLTYTPWEDFDLTQNDCTAEHGFEIQEAGSGEAFQVLSEEFCYQLKCHLKSFNDGTADCGGIPTYQNPRGVKLYAIYLKYFGSQKANVEDLENGKAVDYVKTNHTKEWSAWIAENEELKKMKFSESAGNQFMVLYSQHLVYTGNEDRRKFAVYSLNAAANDSLRTRHGPCMQINYGGNDLAYQAPPVQIDWIGPKKFYNRVLSAIDYLSAEANLLECEACDGDIIKYAFEQLKTPEAQQFIIERCAAIEKDDRIKDYAFQIAKLIDALGPWYKDLDNVSNPDPDEQYNLSGSLDDYIAYLEGGQDFLASKEKKLEKFIELLASNESQSITDLYILLNKFTAADLAALTCEERAAAVQKLTAHHEFGRWIFSNSTSIENAIIKLFQHNESADPNDIQCFLNAIEAIPGLIRNIVQNLDDGGLNANTYSRFFQVVNDLIRKRDAGLNRPDSVIQKVAWDQRTVYEGYGLERPMVNYTQLAIGDTGEISSKVEVIVGTQSIYDPGTGSRVSSILNSHNLNLRPFETVYVVLEGGVKYAGCEKVDDCSASYLEVPGIFLAYMIQKQDAQDRKEALQALAIASSAALVGVLIIETVPAAILISYLQYAAKQCVLGASMDIILQKGIHIMIKDPDRPINATSVLFSCVESSVDVPGIEEINAIMSMAGGCIHAYSVAN